MGRHGRRRRRRDGTTCRGQLARPVPDRRDAAHGGSPGSDPVRPGDGSSPAPGADRRAGRRRAGRGRTDRADGARMPVRPTLGRLGSIADRCRVAPASGGLGLPWPLCDPRHGHRGPRDTAGRDDPGDRGPDRAAGRRNRKPLPYRQARRQHRPPGWSSGRVTACRRSGQADERLSGLFRPGRRAERRSAEDPGRTRRRVRTRSGSSGSATTRTCGCCCCTAGRERPTSTSRRATATCPPRGSSTTTTTSSAPGSATSRTSRRCGTWTGSSTRWSRSARRSGWTGTTSCCSVTPGAGSWPPSTRWPTRSTCAGWSSPP